jgi:hypothetical protein
MSRTLRMLLAVLVAAGSILLAAVTASALTISPTGSYTTTNSGPVTFTFASTGMSATCATVVASETIAADGTGTVPLGGLRFAGCTVAGVQLTVTQLLAGRVAALLNVILPASVLVGRFYVIPLDGINGGIRFAVPGCSWEISGNFNIGRTVPGPLPVMIPAGAPYAVLSSAITVLNVAGPLCAAIGIRNGLAVTAAGSAFDNRAMTYSG